MDKYVKLINSLRCNGDGIAEETDGLGCANKKCKYRDVDGACDLISMALDAAVALDDLTARLSALQAENAEKGREIKRLRKELTKAHTMETLTDYNQDFLRSKIKHVETERDAAVADLHSMHTLCMDIGGCCPECGNQIDELLDAACTYCKGSGVNCWKNDLGNGNKCAAFEWRGAQGEA